jgi:hypothetical protein
VSDIQIDWKQFKTLEDIANKDIQESWLLAVEMIRDVTLLRITATGTWSAMPGILAACEPDGHPALAVPTDRLVIPDCAVGALIGRFGGSSAGYQQQSNDAEKTKPFPIGKYRLVLPPAKAAVPLFIGFNTVYRPVRINNLSLTVEGASPTL